MKLKKNALIGILVISLVALLAVGTWAWFTDKTEPVTNTFKAGTVEIELTNTFGNVTNWNPGDSQTGVITVKNIGTKCAQVRVKLDASWNNNELDDSVVELGLNLTDWTLESDGYYYYKENLTSNAQTTNSLLNSVKLKGAETGNEYQGETFTIDVQAQAIQCSNGATWGEWTENGVYSEQEDPS